ncbi:GNAT family N-acetyltransferase [Sediminibacillus dalangtanensis]|uniref:GNAT family N-acetyltransferase n=1 Tax=Sediminibacillus dalangtanensis TaxID=2729421 RepID=A0ABX7VSG9_9BACI|nr:GNAT family N-acetyltransferase [Sediminibacillus dalangtanensis]QTM98949.1 GNAT family N-acetyltransferase [Sediminibacillus dalangtanensis]
MITIKKAQPEHAAGIASVCTKANWDTYRELRSEAYIERVIEEYYNQSRILKEIEKTGRSWGGWFVALEEGNVVGAAGGGMTEEKEAEIYVLYLDPARRNEGIGTMLLEAVTEQQKHLGAIKQWVSVAEGNQKAIPFYETRGFQIHSKQPDYGSSQDEYYQSLRYMRLL